MASLTINCLVLTFVYYSVERRLPACRNLCAEIPHSRQPCPVLWEGRFFTHSFRQCLTFLQHNVYHEGCKQREKLERMECSSSATRWRRSATVFGLCVRSYGMRVSLSLVLLKWDQATIAVGSCCRVKPFCPDV